MIAIESYCLSWRELHNEGDEADEAWSTFELRSSSPVK